MIRLVIDFNATEVRIIDHWRVNYLSPGREHSREEAIKDLLQRVADDMREMEQGDD
jgi:translation initiation factor IF-3